MSGTLTLFIPALNIICFFQRFFVVDKGILVYGKGPGDIARGKIHGSVDIGLSVVSTKAKRKRIDIDAEEFIYHLKVVCCLFLTFSDSSLMQNMATLLRYYWSRRILTFFLISWFNFIYKSKVLYLYFALLQSCLSKKLITVTEFLCKVAKFYWKIIPIFTNFCCKISVPSVSAAPKIDTS